MAQVTEIPVHKQICASYASGVLSGSKNVLPLSEVEKTYSATEIGKMLGVSSQRIGRSSNRYNLKTPEYGIEVMDKASYCNKDIPNFRYYENAIDIFKKLLSNENKIS